MLCHMRLQLERFRTLKAYKFGDWRKVSIIENHEPLVEVPSEMCYPYYCRFMHLVDDDRVWLRRGVFERFLKASRALRKQGLELVVYDGWRSLQLQENLFWYYMREFTANKFGRKEELQEAGDFTGISQYFASLPPDVRSAMLEANRVYVSWPSKDPGCPSPHATGGSIDVWLFRDGEAVNLGVPFDWMEKDAGTFYHLKWIRKPFPGNDKRVAQNRTRLILAMIDAGFSCYGPEIWHFNYGNQMDGLVKSTNALYSYIEP